MQWSNWKQVKGRRHKRRPNDLSHYSEDEDDATLVPDNTAPVAGTAPSALQASAVSPSHPKKGGGDSPQKLWTCGLVFKNPPEWEILVENTFISVQSWGRHNSRTSLSAPARLITGIASHSSRHCASSSSPSSPKGCRGSPARPQLPADFPNEPPERPPAPPRPGTEAAVVATPSTEALGYMTLVKKRKVKRAQFAQKIEIGNVMVQELYPVVQRDTQVTFDVASSTSDSASSALQEGTSLFGRCLEQDRGAVADAGQISCSPSPSFTIDMPVKPPSVSLQEEDEEVDEEEEDNQATPTQSSRTSLQARRARKRAAKAVGRAREAAGNPQDPGKSADVSTMIPEDLGKSTDVSSMIPAAAKKTVKSANAKKPKPKPPTEQASKLQPFASLTPAVTHFFHARYSDAGFHRSAWPSGRRSREHPCRELALPSEVLAPACSSWIESLDADGERLPELEPEDSGARLGALKRRLADVQVNLQKARAEKLAMNTPNERQDQILREFEGAVRQAEMDVLGEEEKLEKECRKQRAARSNCVSPGLRAPTAFSPASAAADLFFVDRGGAVSPCSPMAPGNAACTTEGFRVSDYDAACTGEASPHADSSADAVALVIQKLARDKALAGLALHADEGTPDRGPAPINLCAMAFHTRGGGAPDGP